METSSTNTQQNQSFICAPSPSLVISITATLEQFSSYPNNIKAKLICAAAELEQSNNTPMYQSPNRATLMGELQHMHVLATGL